MKQVNDNLLEVKLEIIESCVMSIDKLLDILSKNLDDRDILTTICVEVYRQHRLILELVADMVSENIDMSYDIFMAIRTGNRDIIIDPIPPSVDVENYSEKFKLAQQHTNKAIMDIVNKIKETLDA